MATFATKIFSATAEHSRTSLMRSRLIHRKIWSSFTEMVNSRMGAPLTTSSLTSNATSVHACLQAVRARISSQTQLHLLGFAKAEQIHEFAKYGIASFDTTSPLMRAFKDARANYYVTKDAGGIEYYAAIRVPHALESTRLLRGVKEGRIKQEALSDLEGSALRALREFDRGQETIERTVEAVLQYSKVFLSAISERRRR